MFYLDQSPVARQIPFDNSTDGFVSTDVQSAIEEVNAYVSVPLTDQSYYVDKNGNDTTGNGSIGKPYLTIAKALTTITDSSPTKRYGIFVGPGVYVENLVLKANVMIIGSSPVTTVINGSTININEATWNVSADNRSGFQDIAINNVATYDFTAQTNNSQGKLYFLNTRIGGAMTLTAQNSINQFVMQDSEVFAGLTTTGMGIYIGDTAFEGGNIVINSSALSNTAVTLDGGSLLGNITAAYTTGSSVAVLMMGMTISTSTIMTASGASCSITVNDGSLPIPANRSFTSGATLVRANDNYAAGLISATTNVDSSGATAPTAGQVLTATSGTNAIWESPTVTTEVSSTSNATTTSGTDALLTSMTITPAAGTYLVFFTSSITSSAAGAAITYSLYIGGTQSAKTVMKIAPFDGGTLSATTARGAAMIVAQEVVTGSQAIEVRWSTSAGTATCGPRILNVMKVA